MILSLQSAPAAEPVAASDVKSWVRQDSTDDDSFITNTLIPMARRAVETYTQRALITQTWDYYLNRFCNVEIPKAPLQSVSSITYTDTDGAEQTLSSSTYDVYTYSDHPGYVRLAYDQSWPTTRIIEDAVKIRFVAGYGDAGSDVPDDILAGILMTAADFYEQRETLVIGASVNQVPGHIERLLWPYRVMSF